MYITGRLPLLVALGVVPVVLLSVAGVDGWAAAAGWLALCTMGAVVDAAAAPSPRALRIERSAPKRALLGENVITEVRVRNTGARTLRGRLRDAWQPTAGAPLERMAISVAPGEVQAVKVPLRPRRRGELVSRFVVVRSDGPLRFAGRQVRTARDRP